MADSGRAVAGAPSKVEQIKTSSNALRGSLADELAREGDALGGPAASLLKFHGVYQQDDRDRRAELRHAGEGGRQHMFMVRTKLPAGAISGAAYLELDRLAGRYANGSLRITTRQDIQLHGVLKRNLRRTLREINDALLTTLGACGDVVRNVVCCPAPTAENQRLRLLETARALSDHFLPRTRAYAELFLDGEPYAAAADAADAAEQEPFYGAAYLPRKFKIGLALPHDNCIDVHTNDLGLLAVLERGRLRGWDLLAGGGLGMSFGVRTTYPRLASPIAFVPADELFAAVEAVVAIQRDFGNRSDRKRARLKYLIDEWGVEAFREELGKRLGKTPARPVNPPITGIADHLERGEQPDGRFFLGLYVENGRIRDDEHAHLRTALRRAVQRFNLDLRFTPQQNVLLTSIRREDEHPLLALLAEHGVSVKPPLPARRAAMACPALPTCGLAIADAERALPAVVDDVEELLIHLGLGAEPLSIRMTGCPNGCARPWVADIGLVGRTGGAYNVYVGGNPEGTRLNGLVAELVPPRKVAATLRPLFEKFRIERHGSEGFGDFCERVGHATLAQEVERARQADPAIAAAD
ncbi:MAG TPA: NADPH-dependent assimilatory sulfite reductase hemoprotein subunit [Dehalococcoidia bacterium]|nr:NADPH-dependent assimilatory sulfite reductase hemoprotein subunit [Dehalococcoidia bacterium]